MNIDYYSDLNLEFLNKFSLNVRKLTTDIIYYAKVSRIGGVLSIVDILSALYNGFLKDNPKILRHKKNFYCRRISLRE